jgi:UDP-glucose 4-epimerase
LYRCGDLSLDGCFIPIHLKRDMNWDAYSGKTCCITGATGFIGGRLCQRLQDLGCKVRALSRTVQSGPWEDIVMIDLRRQTLPPQALRSCDVVFHLAAKVHADTRDDEDPEGYEAVNCGGTQRLLEAAMDAQVKSFVFFSSVKAMGEAHEGCWDERANPRPVTPYGKSKRQAETLVLGAQQVPHRCVLRPSVVYGPHAKGNLARMIRAVERGYFPPLPPIDNQRSMVHVDDIVAAALHAAMHPRAQQEVFIVTDGRVYSTSEIYIAIRQALGQAPPRWHLPQVLFKTAALGGDILSRFIRQPMPIGSRSLNKVFGSECYDGSRIMRALGFQPQHDLMSSLPDIVANQRGTSTSLAGRG